MPMPWTQKYGYQFLLTCKTTLTGSFLSYFHTKISMTQEKKELVRIIKLVKIN